MVAQLNTGKVRSIVNRLIHHPPGTCEGCGDEFHRQRKPGGRLEPGPAFARRRFCGVKCAAANAREHRHQLRQWELDVIEDVEWIIAFDTPENVATRVGYKNPSSLARTLFTAGRADLANRLQARHSEYVSAAG